MTAAAPAELLVTMVLVSGDMVGFSLGSILNRGRRLAKVPIGGVKPRTRPTTRGFASEIRAPLLPLHTKPYNS